VYVTQDEILRGVRVVDMTEALAGPYCAMYLGDMGADVVKVSALPGDRRAQPLS
jgi:formyl-CoA transferase